MKEIIDMKLEIKSDSTKEENTIKAGKYKINDDELLILMKNEYYRINPKDNKEFFRERDKRIPGKLSLKKRCGGLTYNEILELAGVENKKLNLRKKVKEDTEELLKEYKEFSNKQGHPATCKELNSSNEIYNASIFTIRFGGMSQLRTAAGFETIYYKTKWSKSKIENMLIQLRKEKGRKLVTSDIKKYISIMTVLKYYKTTKISEIFNEIESKINL
ncbi:MAG: hypothetical protein SPE00_05835 [Bacilli bacterium]|nr:hypothetical protein [Bacilli bacterium]